MRSTYRWIIFLQPLKWNVNNIEKMTIARSKNGYIDSRKFVPVDIRGENPSAVGIFIKMSWMQIATLTVVDAT